MKFIILVFNLKEISPSVFSWKKEYVKNYDAIYGRKHIGLVISPLKSLMIDQCKQAKHVFAIYK
jgi:hypothetical protein